MASKLRADIKVRVSKFKDQFEDQQDDSHEEYKDHQSVLRRSFTKKKDRQQEVYSLIGSECKTIMTRRKPLTKHMLTVDMIRQILLGVT